MVALYSGPFTKPIIPKSAQKRVPCDNGTDRLSLCVCICNLIPIVLRTLALPSHKAYQIARS
jgi:hypothetical protein